ncbi:hypothetical protein MHU86_5300 [Fragilaria crotonensis]|nr:hypothetical protein MHU86_5300 [Fragilaria crotonensis]
MTVETAAATLAAEPLVFGDGMTAVETDAAASLAAAPLVFGDGMTAVETDAAASVLTGVVRLFPGATLLRVTLAAAVRGDSSGYGCGLARSLVLHLAHYPLVILCSDALGTTTSCTAMISTHKSSPPYLLQLCNSGW